MVSGRGSFPVLQIAVFSLYILTWGTGGRKRQGGREEGRDREGGRRLPLFIRTLLLLEQGSTLTISLYLNHPLRVSISTSSHHGGEDFNISTLEARSSAHSIRQDSRSEMEVGKHVLIQILADTGEMGRNPESISGFLGARMQEGEIFYPKLSELRLIKESGKPGLLK